MRVARSGRVLAAVLALALSATACGSDGSEQTGSEDTAAPTTADDPTTGGEETETTGGEETETTASDSATGTSTEIVAPEGAQLGFSVYDMQYTFFQAMEEGTRTAAEAAGYEYQLHDQQSDESQMVSGAQNLIQQGVDALVISPIRPDALGPVVQAAKEAGTPVVVNDIGGGGTDYDAIVISDNEDGGVQAADYMAELMPEEATQVASITCEPSAEYAARRNQGFEARAEELGYEVAASLNANSNADEAYTVMQDILSSNPDVAGVFACNDPMAVGAANAIRDAGMDPVNDIVTVGFNGDPEALDAISSGNLAGSIAQFPSLMGELSVRLATQLVNGESLTFDNEADREIFAPVTLVTPDNVETYADEVTLD